MRRLISVIGIISAMVLIGTPATRGIPNQQTGFTDFVSQTRSGNTQDLCALLA